MPGAAVQSPGSIAQTWRNSSGIGPGVVCDGGNSMPGSGVAAYEGDDGAGCAASMFTGVPGDGVFSGWPQPASIIARVIGPPRRAIWRFIYRQRRTGRTGSERNAAALRWESRRNKLRYSTRPPPLGRTLRLAGQGDRQGWTLELSGVFAPSVASLRREESR